MNFLASEQVDIQIDRQADGLRTQATGVEEAAAESYKRAERIVGEFSPPPGELFLVMLVCLHHSLAVLRLIQLCSSPGFVDRAREC